MWAQYGENHEGICLAFSKKILFETIHNDTKNKLVFGDSVDYVDDLKRTIVINHDAIKNSLNESMDYNEIVYSIFDEIQKIIYFTKDSDFESEDEFRFVTIRKSEADKILNNKLPNINTPLLYHIKDAILGIIGGENISDTYDKTILEFCKKYKVRYGKLLYDNSNYCFVHNSIFE